MPRARTRELTFDVARSWRMPDLVGLVPRGRDLEALTDELQASYLDTGQATLQRLGVTLWRRTGGADAGWRLTIADGIGRTEFQSRANGERIPASLARRLAGVVAGQELGEVATITSTRHASRLLDERGALVVQVADAQVSGVGAGEVATLDSWREVEVELGPAGDESVLGRVATLFRGAGARPAKMQRTLDGLLARSDSEPGGTFDRALTAYVQAQCTAILLGDIALRDQPTPEAVHRPRVGIRRLRSTVRSFGGALALDEAAATALDNNLRWLAGLLGAIRDVDILARRLTGEMTALPAEDVLGPVVRDIEETISTERSAAIAAWRAAWTDDRYPAIMATLASWLVEVPLADAAIDGRKVIAKAQRRADRRLHRAKGDPHELHQARKAAKRLRYAAELLGGSVPKAARIAKHAKQVQTVLGDHQDLAVTADFLRRQGAVAGARPGHNGFTYGLLMARVEEQAARVRAGL